MKDIRAVRFNEKVRRVSALLGAGSIAQLLTAFTRFNGEKGAVAAAVWVVTGVLFMFMAVKINDLMVLEDAE